MTRLLRIAALCLLLAACAGPRVAERSPNSSAAAPACVQTSHGCLALNPGVTPETIGRTICLPGYTRTVRPPTSYTNGVKAYLLRQAGINVSHMSEYELDHVVPLALGGHPRDPSNLALQPWEGEHGAKPKDALEARLHERVCRGEMSLADAQRCVAENWEACARGLL